MSVCPYRVWLAELGFDVCKIRPMVEAVQPGDAKWAWLRSFFHLHRPRLMEMGYLSGSVSARIWEAFSALESARGTMITPGVMEIIARLR